MIPVKVDQLFLSNMGFVVLLKGLQDERSLPIFIGAAEAQAIAFRINDVKVPRPLTHDLFKNVLDYLECRLMRIEVCDIRDDTFFARLVLERDGQETVIDSRPSDAIALGLRFDAPILVAEEVMAKAGRVMEEGVPAAGGIAAEAGGEPHKERNPLDALKRKLERAVKEERYEDAAKVRDEIKRLENAHPGN